MRNDDHVDALAFVETRLIRLSTWNLMVFLVGVLVLQIVVGVRPQFAQGQIGIILVWMLLGLLCAWRVARLLRVDTHHFAALERLYVAVDANPTALSRHWALWKYLMWYGYVARWGQTGVVVVIIVATGMLARLGSAIPAIAGLALLGATNLAWLWWRRQLVDAGGEL